MTGSADRLPPPHQPAILPLFMIRDVETPIDLVSTCQGGSNSESVGAKGHYCDALKYRALLILLHNLLTGLRVVCDCFGLFICVLMCSVPRCTHRVRSAWKEIHGVLRRGKAGGIVTNSKVG